MNPYGLDALIPILIIGLPLWMATMFFDWRARSRLKAKRGAYRL